MTPVVKESTTRRPRMAELARLRQAVYRLLACQFMFPEPDMVMESSGAARALEYEMPWAEEFAFYGPWRDYAEALSNVAPAEIVGLAEQYQDLFSMDVLHSSVPLTETEYLGDLLQTGQIVASIEQHYASAGLATRSDTAEPFDHVSVELEFISYLCGKEAEAWESGELKVARSVMGRQRRFMEKHPTRWVPLLAARLTSDTGLYRQAAVVAETLLVHDVDFLAAARAHLKDNLAENDRATV